MQRGRAITESKNIPAGWVKRVHAWCLGHCTGKYERMVTDRKKILFAGLQGSILEIGPGAGPNLKFMPGNSRWIGVEPNPFMHPYLKTAAADLSLEIEIFAATAERLPAEDASADVVISTLVLCSVSDPAATLKEIIRVLKPGGRFIFIEHVAAPEGSFLRRVQHLIRSVWKRIADGCHTDRETWATIQAAGFSEVSIEYFRVPLGPVSTQISGYAVK